jgi:hypothetical protein
MTGRIWYGRGVWVMDIVDAVTNKIIYRFVL